MEEQKLYQPEVIQSYAQFKQGTISNIETIFAMDTKSQELSLENFLENADHGLEHEYNVYQKAIQIAERYEEETGKKIRKYMIYPMAIVHDAMRSLKYDDTDPRKARKEKRNDDNHEKYGVFLFKKILQSLGKKNIFMNLSIDEQEEIQEYLVNHDYFSEQLNGGRFSEPKTLEGQVVRLADRISVPLQDEIQRYRDTGKRLNTVFLNNSFPLQERENFSFDKMKEKEYDKYDGVDEVMFFTALLMITKKDFSDPVLGEIYSERAVEKDNAVDFITEIGKKEGATPEHMEQLKSLLIHLGKKFNFSVKE